MKKTNKKSVNLHLRILTIFAFSLIFIPFNKAAAQSNIQSCGDGGCNTYWGGNNSIPVTPIDAYYNINPYQTNFYSNPTPASTVSSNNVNSNKTKTTTQTNTSTNQTTNTSNTVTPGTDNNTNTVSENSGSDLASNAIFGSSSFLPSGLVQWILFAIFILLIIILVRRIFGAKEAYEELPMKYE